MPLVGVPACVTDEDSGSAFHKVGEKYLMAVARAAHCMPVIIPALGNWCDAHDLAGRLDSYRRQIQRWEKDVWFELAPDRMQRLLEILGASSL